MSGVTENKFIFPQWKRKEKKKKRPAQPVGNKCLHVAESGRSGLEHGLSSM